MTTITADTLGFAVAVVLVLAAVLFGVLVLVRWGTAEKREWKTLAFLGCGLLPILAMASLTGRALEDGQGTDFCTSCHVMKNHGKSLQAEGDEYIPAVHFKNNWVPKKQACYTCHTSYTWYGTAHGKWRGMQHMFKNVFGEKGELKVYQPYHNRECLQCHGGGERFEKRKQHKTETTLRELYDNKTSCLECHDVIHEADEFKGE